MGNMVIVGEGKLRMVVEEDNLKDQEGKPRQREEDRQKAEEDNLKLVGKLIEAESIVLVGTEMVQSMVLMNMELEAHMVVNRNFVSLPLHNVV